MALALASGIAPSVWAAEGEQAIWTAWELIEEANRKAKGG